MCVVICPEVSAEGQPIDWCVGRLVAVNAVENL